MKTERNAARACADGRLFQDRFQATVRSVDEEIASRIHLQRVGQWSVATASIYKSLFLFLKFYSEETSRNMCGWLTLPLARTTLAAFDVELMKSLS